VRQEGERKKLGSQEADSLTKEQKRVPRFLLESYFMDDNFLKLVNFFFSFFAWITGVNRS
jgi:hypothetical protein